MYGKRIARAVMIGWLESKAEYDKICIELENFDEHNKGKLVNSMGGRVLELPSDQLRYAEANGIRIGEANGIKIGEAKGITKGIDYKTVNVIRNMLLRGHKDEDIIAIAECTKEQIDDVRKSME